MKKRLISAICSLIIALTQTGAVFAAEESVENEEIIIADSAVSEETGLSEGADENPAPTESGTEENAQTDNVPLFSGEENEALSDAEEVENAGEAADYDSLTDEGSDFLRLFSTELEMSYRYRTSKNGEETSTYSEIKDFGFSEDVSGYNIFLPDNTQYAYLKIAAPTEAQVEVYTINGENNELVGFTEMASTSINQFRIKNPTLTENISGEGYYVIPVKNEYATASVEYTINSETKTYSVKFYAKQPRLSYFNQLCDSNVTFISGAAANNDNGSIIDSGADSNIIRALANVSEKLVGSSIFMLPITEMKKSGSWFIKNKNADMFEFEADSAGTVYVLTYAANTTNFNTENGWTAYDKNGTNPTGITVSSSSSTARTKNDYTNTDYFAAMYGWKCLKDSADFTGANKNRANKLTGSLSTSYVDSNGTKALKYTYYKSFAKGERVAIPVPSEMATSWQGMAVLVQWDVEINENVISMTEEDLPGGAVFRIAYSDNETSYTKISKKDYDSDNSYTVNFEDNKSYAYIKLSVPEGSSVSVKTDSGITVTEKDGHYMVPITDSSVTTLVNYRNAENEEILYKVIFNSKQSDAVIKMKYSDNAEISFLSGARVHKNNYPFLSEEDTLDKTECTLADASEELYGASVFILPLEDMRTSGSWVSEHFDEDMFSFIPDADGRVYVMTDSPAVLNSEYELIWDVRDLSGKLKTVITDRISGNIMRNESITLNKVYSYDFVKDEEVGIPVPEVESWKGNMAVLIKWK